MEAWLAAVSLVISIVTGPVVIAAVYAMHKSSTTDLIEKALDKEREVFERSLTAEREQRTKEMTSERERTKEALATERDRNGEVYALKHEVSEMKGHVMQLVTNTSQLDTKLDRMQELLLSLQRTR